MLVQLLLWCKIRTNWCTCYSADPLQICSGFYTMCGRTLIFLGFSAAIIGGLQADVSLGLDSDIHNAASFDCLSALPEPTAILVSKGSIVSLV